MNLNLKDLFFGWLLAALLQALILELVLYSMIKLCCSLLSNYGIGERLCRDCYRPANTFFSGPILFMFSVDFAVFVSAFFPTDCETYFIRKTGHYREYVQE